LPPGRGRSTSRSASAGRRDLHQVAADVLGGTGADVGIHPKSAWNNPEPEVVLFVNSRGTTVGAHWATTSTCATSRGAARCCSARRRTTTHRARSARSAPLRRALRHRRRAQCGDRAARRGGRRVRDGRQELDGTDQPRPARSRRPGNRAEPPVPDGLVLFCGTMFAPVQDRRGPGKASRTRSGRRDRRHARLGALVNRVNRTDAIAPWTFGTRALMHNLARRGLL